MGGTRAPGGGDRKTDAAPATKGARRIVLIVDDEPDVLDSYRRLIEGRLANTTALTAHSAKEAFKVLARTHVDVILADYRMPEMDGIEFLAQARQMNPRIGRIIFTAYAEPELARRAAAQAMVDEFLSKDVDPETVLRRIDELMRP